MFYIVEWR